jgi:hypothetical protein
VTEALGPYAPLGGQRHRDGDALTHAHPHDGPHVHPRRMRDRHEHDHGHSHGLVHESIKRSRDGVRAVGLALAVLGAAALLQTAVFVASGSVALLADLIHNFGDAATALPLGIAFWLRSQRAERLAGLAVVATIFVSACVAVVEAIARLVHPSTPAHLGVLAAAGAIGFAGNWIAAAIRTRAGHRLDSPALMADGARARGRLRQPGGRRQCRGRRARRADRRPDHRSGHHARDPAHHVDVAADRARRSPSRPRALSDRSAPSRPAALMKPWFHCHGDCQVGAAGISPAA